MKKITISLLKTYHSYLAPFLPPTCRFTPTCSEYAIGVIERYGLIQGLWKSIIRIGKCHPFHPGGYDPVKKI